MSEFDGRIIRRHRRRSDDGKGVRRLVAGRRFRAPARIDPREAELFFRTFKQTFGRRKLHSHKAEHAQLEADWSLVALWAVCLLAQRAIGKSGGDPCQLSPAGAIKAIQKVMCQYRNRPEDPTESLGWMFRNALLDDYQRTSSKTARAYPKKRKRERTGVPTIASASKSQINTAKQFKARERQLRLSA